MRFYQLRIKLKNLLFVSRNIQHKIRSYMHKLKMLKCLVVSIFGYNNYYCCFYVTHLNYYCIYIVVWLKALSSAACGEHHHPAVDYEYYYNRLGLDSTLDYEPSVVNRTFRNLVAESPVGNDGRAHAVS